MKTEQQKKTALLAKARRLMGQYPGIRPELAAALVELEAAAKGYHAARKRSTKKRAAK